MRTIALTLALALGAAAPFALAKKPKAAQVDPGAFASLSLTALDGTPFDMSQLEGKAVLFVNVASRCGYTPQYEGLQALYEAYEAKGLVLVGVPSNQFAGQEPGTAEEIASFCKINYGVTFPLLEKQKVTGGSKGPLYRYLSADGSNVKWNFEKYLVNPSGEVVAHFRSQTRPDDPELLAAIEGALPQ